MKYVASVNRPGQPGRPQRGERLDHDLIRVMHHEGGLSYQQIARELGCHSTSVGYIIRSKAR